MRLPKKFLLFEVDSFRAFPDEELDLELTLWVELALYACA